MEYMSYYTKNMRLVRYGQVIKRVKVALKQRQKEQEANMKEVKSNYKKRGQASQVIKNLDKWGHETKDMQNKEWQDKWRKYLEEKVHTKKCMLTPSTLVF